MLRGVHHRGGKPNVVLAMGKLLPDHSRSDILEAQPMTPQTERNIAGLEIAS